MNAVVLAVAKRVGLSVVTLFAISVLIFLCVEALPGDFAQTILGQSASPEAVAALRRELGLDTAPHLRYIDWVSGILQGDFGRSLAAGRPVAPLIAERLWNTAFLALTAAAVAVPLALILGLVSALYQGSAFDRTVSILTLWAISSPEFFVAYVLVALFAVQLPVFPSLAQPTSDMPLWEQLYTIGLPALTLNFVVVAHMMRMTRAALINVMSRPFVRMAELKGLGRWRVVYWHALPNALGPIINVVVLNLAYMVVGVVVVEVIFVYPGLGKLLVDSVAKRDLPVVQASCLIFAVTYLALNTLADVLATVSNPRLLHPR
jgi:peptide/nickel transport system permease protein